MLCWIFLTLIWLENWSVSRNVVNSHLKLRWNSQTGRKEDTLARWLNRMGEHSARWHDEVFRELQQVVVGPLIRAIVQICTDEVSRLRTELFDLTKTAPEHHPKIRKAIDEALERIGDRMSNEAMHDIADKVKAVVGQKTGRSPASH